MKSTAGIHSLIALVATLAVACSDEGSGTGTAPVGGGGRSGGEFAGSCDNAPAGFCNEFTGSGYTAAKTQSDCEALGANIQYLPGRCPTDGRVGTCVVYAGKASESYYRYYAT
ncbi:MAG TPA: hypothetical protein VHE30_16845, partial [Polyangiaceae bacterium]|nr:hypothetical protein [Polyangiaceae bacterium]